MQRPDAVAGVSPVRLYGGAIAVVSGLYSVLLSTAGPGTSANALVMLLLGVVVLAHGLVLLTPYAARLGDASGPLMLGYGTLMLLLQAWMAVTGAPGGAGMNGGGMDDGMGMDGGAWMGTTAGDAGMVALAVLMLASGLIMTASDGMAVRTGEERGME